MRTLHKSWLLQLLGWLALALALRVYHWSTGPFGFDQVQILEAAEKIAAGDITLIGPRTGPAPIFTGPLIYYVTAFWLLTLKPIAALLATNITFVLLTGSTLYFLSKRTLIERQAHWVMAAWAISPLLISLDRITWNPNISILAAVLVFFPLLESFKTKTITKTQLSFLALGSFLGYQAHFSGLLMPALAVVLAVMIHKWPAWKVAVVTGLGLGASLVPTFLFDLRNNWLNWNGVQQLLSGQGGTALKDRILYVLITFHKTLENLGGIIWLETPSLVRVAIGIVILLSFLWWRRQVTAKKETTGILISLSWIFLYAILISFYKGNKPEYYYLVQVPALLALVAQVATAVLPKNSHDKWLLASATILVATWVFTHYAQPNGVSLSNQLAAKVYVEGLQPEKSLKSLVYDMEPVHALGLQYLFKQTQLSDSGAVLHFQYPYQSGTLTSQNWSDFGVWVDPRVNPEASYLTKPSYILGLRPAYELKQVYSRYTGVQADVYDLVAESENGVEVTVVKLREVNSENPEFVQLYQAQTGNSFQTWTQFKLEDKNTQAWGYQTKNHFLMVSDTTEPVTTENPSEWLEFID